MALVPTFLTTTVSAAETVNVALPTEIQVKGNSPKPEETYSLVLTPENDETPMPSGAGKGEYVMSQVGPGTGAFPPISYDRVGIYHYTIHQEKGKSSLGTYDDTVYSVTVSVTNGSAGLETTVAVHPSGKDVKVEAASFVNTYAYPPSDTPKTGDMANFPLYGVLAAVGVGILAALFMTRRKEENQ